jgi:formate dehydrogenase iron-sulfur subunit
MSVHSPRLVPLVEQLLGEQQSLSAVERFAACHEPGATSARLYRDLMPARSPGPGQQYAFEVDLDACTGCKACVTACHSLNGLDDQEIWRTAGLLQGGETGAGQTVTTSCHHCVDPGCLAGCPVKAYEKDPVTGIVRHLDDQCIGCQYCTLMCPYDAPRYSAARGIVRKCDMCSDRLGSGEAPACVQACPGGAIRIQVVNQVDAIRSACDGAFLPGAPAPLDTLPTTVYRSDRPRPANLLPADFYQAKREPAHPPLAVMLTLTQLAVGAVVIEAVWTRLLGRRSMALSQALFALALAAVALTASLFHLGRPQLAFRAVLGWRTSWLSREILAFGAFAQLGALRAAARAAPELAWLPGAALLRGLTPLLQGLTVAAGVTAVACSVMVYAATRRRHWTVWRTAPRFLLTALILGTAATLAVAACTATRGAGPEQGELRALWRFLVLVTLAKLLWDGMVLRHLRQPAHTLGRRTAVLMTTDLAGMTAARFGLAALGGVVVPLLWLARSAVPSGAPNEGVLAMLVLLVLTSSELCERYLFFAAAPPSRMPGAPGWQAP